MFCRIPEIMEECSSWFHWRREDWWVPQETRNFINARNGTKESGQFLQSNKAFFLLRYDKISNISSILYHFVSLQAWKFLLSFVLLDSYFRSSPVTRPEKEKAGWPKKATLQGAQQPLGRCPGGLLRRRSCEEVKVLCSSPRRINNL